MNTKWIAVLILIVALSAVAIVATDAQTQSKTPSQAAQLEKIVEQNEKIISGQAEILKAVSQMREDIMILKRRSS